MRGETESNGFSFQSMVREPQLWGSHNTKPAMIKKRKKKSKTSCRRASRSRALEGPEFWRCKQQAPAKGSRDSPALPKALPPGGSTSLSFPPRADSTSAWGSIPLAKVSKERRGQQRLPLPPVSVCLPGAWGGWAGLRASLTDGPEMHCSCSWLSCLRLWALLLCRV